MILVFLACGLIALADLGVKSPAEFWRAATSEIWPGGTPMAEPKFTIWHVIFFSWLCNAPWHLGLSDMTLFRYARKPSAGWASLAGMYIGHYMAWVAASLLLALQLKNHPLAPGTSPTVAPGPLAYHVAGIAGVLCVVIAGWTTANPTIYRAGLALQSLRPRSSTFVVTLLAGGLATVAGLFPAVAMKLLDFVGFFGTAIAPVGAIILADHYFAKRLGFPADWAAAANKSLNWPAAIAWLAVLAVASLMIFKVGVFGSFVALPAWLATGALYLVLSRLRHRQPSSP
jgi:purine-cytosine permease-like protein